MHAPLPRPQWPPTPGFSETWGFSQRQTPEGFWRPADEPERETHSTSPTCMGTVYFHQRISLKFKGRRNKLKASPSTGTLHIPAAVRRSPVSAGLVTVYLRLGFPSEDCRPIAGPQRHSENTHSGMCYMAMSPGSVTQDTFKQVSLNRNTHNKPMHLSAQENAVIGRSRKLTSEDAPGAMAQGLLIQGPQRP